MREDELLRLSIDVARTAAHGGEYASSLAAGINRITGGAVGVITMSGPPTTRLASSQLTAASEVAAHCHLTTCVLQCEPPRITRYSSIGTG